MTKPKRITWCIVIAAVLLLAPLCVSALDVGITLYADDQTFTKLNDTFLVLGGKTTFNIESSQEILYVGTIENTKEWEYEGSGIGTETILSDKELFQWGDMICSYDYETIKSQSNHVWFPEQYKYSCIYYPKQLINISKELGKTVWENRRIITKLNKNSYRVDYQLPYDPTATYNIVSSACSQSNNYCNNVGSVGTTIFANATNTAMYAFLFENGLEDLSPQNITINFTGVESYVSMSDNQGIGFNTSGGNYARITYDGRALTSANIMSWCIQFYWEGDDVGSDNWAMFYGNSNEKFTGKDDNAIWQNVQGGTSDNLDGLTSGQLDSVPYAGICMGYDEALGSDGTYYYSNDTQEAEDSLTPFSGFDNSIQVGDSRGYFRMGAYSVYDERLTDAEGHNISTSKHVTKFLYGQGINFTHQFNTGVAHNRVNVSLDCTEDTLTDCCFMVQGNNTWYCSATDGIEVNSKTTRNITVKLNSSAYYQTSELNSITIETYTSGGAPANNGIVINTFTNETQNATRAILNDTLSEAGRGTVMLFAKSDCESQQVDTDHNASDAPTHKYYFWGLNESTQYFARLNVTNGDKTNTSACINFTTQAINVKTIRVITVTNVTNTNRSFEIYSDYDREGNITIKLYDTQYCVNRVNDATYNTSIGLGHYTWTVNDLSCDTSYWTKVRVQNITRDAYNDSACVGPFTTTDYQCFGGSNNIEVTASQISDTNISTWIQDDTTTNAVSTLRLYNDDMCLDLNNTFHNTTWGMSHDFYLKNLDCGFNYTYVVNVTNYIKDNETACNNFTLDVFQCNYNTTGCVSNWTNSTPTLANVSGCFINDTYNLNYTWYEYDTAGCNLTNTTYYDWNSTVCNYCTPVNQSYECVNTSFRRYNDSAYLTCCDITNNPSDCINGDDNTTWNNIYVNDTTCSTPYLLKYDTTEGNKMDYYLMLAGIVAFCAFMLWLIYQSNKTGFMPGVAIALAFFLLGIAFIGKVVIDGQQECDLVVNETQELAGNITTYTYQGICINETSTIANNFYYTIMVFITIIGGLLLVYGIYAAGLLLAGSYKRK